MSGTGGFSRLCVKTSTSTTFALCVCHAGHLTFTRLEWRPRRVLERGSAGAASRPGWPAVSVRVESPMDIMTGAGLVAGTIVVATMMLLGGDLAIFISDHAIIIIFGGSFAATLIRFPLSAILHGVPLGAKFAFTLSRKTARELVDELANLAEVARKQGPVGLEKVEIEDPFLAKGIRFVADGYDAEFIRDNLERDRDNFLTHFANI